MVEAGNVNGTQLAGGAVLREARPGDERGILDCIRMLAEYEHEPDGVKTTEAMLRETLFGSHPSVFAHLIEKSGSLVGVAVWFLNYSTWTGTYGRALLQRLASIAVTRGYERFEWSVLEWNEPSIEFYRNIGATGMDQWRVQRVSGSALRALAD
jgi:Acetyltransferase (GNAT) family